MAAYLFVTGFRLLVFAKFAKIMRTALVIPFPALRRPLRGNRCFGGGVSIYSEQAWAYLCSEKVYPPFRRVNGGLPFRGNASKIDFAKQKRSRGLDSEFNGEVFL